MTTHDSAAGGPARSRPATRRDVARLAGTSTAVVSYVINNGPRRVADETQARVLAAVKELDYRPNALARSLRAQRTQALGLIVPDLANPFFAELARSIEMQGFEYGEALLLGNSMGAEERERQYVRTFLEYRLGGLIIVPVGDGRMSRAELLSSEIPVVVLDRYVPGLAAPTILPDNVEGARAATMHLLEHGYAEVACMAGPPDLPTADERLAGWAAALDQAGVAEDRRVVVRSQFGRKASYLAARELLARRKRPRSLFASSDEQAFGVLRAAAQLKLRVPEDLAVVGFDGLQHSRSAVPQLTTMRQPFEEAGAIAVRILHHNVADAGAQILRLPVTFQRGGSCGCEEDLEEGDASE
jgi:LacI family transcriptional regulator, galactose operon repressor